jgi:hypothetical protein
MCWGYSWRHEQDHHSLLLPLSYLVAAAAPGPLCLLVCSLITYIFFNLQKLYFQNKIVVLLWVLNLGCPTLSIYLSHS